MQIVPVDEHDPRFNVSKTKIEQANEAIRNLSKLKKEESGIDVEIVGDKLIHKRTSEDYVKCWNKFLEEEEKEFEESLAYGRETIARIGVEKFIDAQDWRDEYDVCKWKTDAAHVIPCLHCGDEFAHIQFSGSLGLYGLCSKCVKLYDLPRIDSVSEIKAKDEKYEDIPDAGVRFAVARTRVIEQFVMDSSFRGRFLVPSKK